MSSGFKCTAVIGLFGLLLTSVQNTYADELFSVIPVARYVLETREFQNYDVYVKAMSDGTFRFDDTMRHPFLPLGSIYVDCQKTRQIGVTLRVLPLKAVREYMVRNRYRKIPVGGGKRIRVRYQWSHPEVPKSRRHTWYSNLWAVIDKNPLGNISDGLILRRKDRVEGAFTVTITYKDMVVYSTSFELVGCRNDD